MNLYIHSSGRPTMQEQKTLGSMAGAFPRDLKNVHLVVQGKQEKEYCKVAEQFGVDLIVLPPSIKTLSPTRQWILDGETKPFAMMDDDLLFFERRKDDPTKFLKITGSKVFEMFHDLFDRMLCGGFPHGGILAREGGNRIVGKDNVFNTRMMRVLAYEPRTVRKVGARLDRLPTKQDFDMTLQLLRAGYSNLLMADYVQGQYNEGCSNAPGGCSVYRTPKMNAESSERLAKLHPGFVKVVEKKASTSWGGEPRIDVVVSWKKAYESSGAAK